VCVQVKRGIPARRLDMREPAEYGDQCAGGRQEDRQERETDEHELKESRERARREVPGGARQQWHPDASAEKEESSYDIETEQIEAREGQRQEHCTVAGPRDVSVR